MKSEYSHPWFWLLMLTATQLGCSQLLPEMTPFGAVRGVDATRSLNGLGVHKKIWESAGIDCFTASKLSPRLDSFDAIVLVGQDYSPPGRAARDWLENWLAESNDRTVIYFGRDFSADVYYHSETLQSISPEQRDRGRLELAEAQTAELNLRLRELPESTFCRWFYLDCESEKRVYTSFSGPWAKHLGDQAGKWPVRVTLQPPTKKWLGKTPSWVKSAPQTAGDETKLEEEQAAAEKSIVRSTWKPEELDSKQEWNSEFEKAMQADVMLSGDDGLPLVFRLSHQESENSHIFIVTNGAPFLNGSLVQPLHREVARLIMQECLPAKKVALIPYDQYGLLISKTREEESQGAGLEMLTVWPLSAITMPAALLGIIICAALFPILGRPQLLPRRSVTDFGMHIDAIGNMLMRTNDTGFAKQAIRDYFQQVRQEEPPAWLDSIAEHRKYPQPGATPVVAAPTPENTATSSPNPTQIPGSQEAGTQEVGVPETGTEEANAKLESAGKPPNEVDVNSPPKHNP